jgi:DNA-binding GntR family transcriptional regulator
MLRDIDAGYSPRYVKLARVLRDKITRGQYKHGDPVPAVSLAREHQVSIRVVRHTMEMLAARQVRQSARNLSPCIVNWTAGA